MERVGYVAAQACGCLAEPRALFRAAATRRPVVDYYGHACRAQEAYHTHLVARAEVGQRVYVEQVVGDVDGAEILRVVEQSHVHAAAVRGVVVHYAEVAVSQRLGLDEVFEHGAVLDFADAYHGRTVGRRLCGELRDGVGHVVDFAPILLAVPLAVALRRELQVVFSVVVDGVEEVFKVVESHTVHLGRFLAHRGFGLCRKQESAEEPRGCYGGCYKSLYSHISGGFFSLSLSVEKVTFPG